MRTPVASAGWTGSSRKQEHSRRVASYFYSGHHLPVCICTHAWRLLPSFPQPALKDLAPFLSCLSDFSVLLCDSCKHTNVPQQLPSEKYKPPSTPWLPPAPLPVPVPQLLQAPTFSLQQNYSKESFCVCWLHALVFQPPITFSSGLFFSFWSLNSFLLLL